MLHGRKKKYRFETTWGRENHDVWYWVKYFFKLMLDISLSYISNSSYYKNMGFVKVMGQQSVPIHWGIYFPLSFFPLIYCCTAQNAKTVGYLLNNNTGTLCGHHYDPILPRTAVTKYIQTRGHIFNVTALQDSTMDPYCLLPKPKLFSTLSIFFIFGVLGGSKVFPHAPVCLCLICWSGGCSAVCHYLIKADYSLWNILYIPALEQEVAVGFPYLYSKGVLILYETS